MNMKEYRKQIDALDQELVALINKRLDVAKKIGEVKKEANKEIYAPHREKEVYEKVQKLNSGPIQNESLKAIYREIMSTSLSMEKKIRIAYLGPQATFTHQASLLKFGSSIDYLPMESIGDIFHEVAKGRADYGVVPVENSIEGAVTHTFDMFIDSNVKICSEIFLNISQTLMGNCSLHEIKRVYSKFEVFGQCRIWLRENLKNVELVEVSSTAKAAQIVKDEKNAAAIASILAAKLYDIPVLAESIEDFFGNITRFLVIGQNCSRKTENDKTSIMFSIKDKVGALYEALLPFKHCGINLTKIESRPSKKKAWDYYFYVDLLGHCEEEKVKKAINELSEHCVFVKILGSYPCETK